MTRVSGERLARMAAGMTPREREVVEVVHRLKLVSHAQLRRIAGDSSDVSPSSAARTCRGLLKRLHDHQVLGRLDRRIGGVRAGSSGHVYYLGSVGQRLVAFWNGEGAVRGRARPEPGAAFVHHRLSVSEIYVQAHEAERRGDLELLGFEVEPDCWRRSIDEHGGQTMLKPDAFLRVAAGAYEDRWFLEVDLGTESRSVLRRKLRAYIDYFHTGAEQDAGGVFPRVLWATDSETRRTVLVDLCAGLPAEYWQLFAVSTIDHATELVRRHLEDEAHDGPGGAS